MIRFRSDVEPTPVKAFEKIKAGLDEALAVSKGEAEPFAVHVRRGPKPSDKSKKLLTLRLDPDVIDAFKATGEGWQARMNEALRKSVGL